MLPEMSPNIPFQSQRGDFLIKLWYEKDGEMNRNTGGSYIPRRSAKAKLKELCFTFSQATARVFKTQGKKIKYLKVIEVPDTSDFQNRIQYEMLKRMSMEDHDFEQEEEKEFGKEIDYKVKFYFFEPKDMLELAQIYFDSLDDDDVMKRHRLKTGVENLF